MTTCHRISRDTGHERHHTPGIHNKPNDRCGPYYYYAWRPDQKRLWRQIEIQIDLWKFDSPKWVRAVLGLHLGNTFRSCETIPGPPVSFGMESRMDPHPRDSRRFHGLRHRFFPPNSRIARHQTDIKRSFRPQHFAAPTTGWECSGRK